MKKTLYIIVALMSVSLLVMQCGDEESGTSVSKITGDVMLDGAAAGGAIITLSDAPNAANVIATTISDSMGAYSFMGVENGTYYLNARFDPNNTNNLMKSASAVILTGSEVEVAVDGDVEKDVDIVGMASTGTGTISTNGGSVLDGTHSAIAFEFPYDGVNAVFKGHFATVGVDAIEFSEADPSTMSVKAWVDLTSVETGAPSGFCGHGRDGITGCIQGTFKVETDDADTVMVYCEDGEMETGYPNTEGVAYDLWGDGSTTSYEKPSAIIGATGVATFKISAATAYGSGYKATASFTFAGTTQNVDFYFSYIDGYQKESNGVTTSYNSIYGWFKFNPDAIGVSSSHLGTNDVTVKISAQFKK